jgi:hypothetical protein
MDKREEANRAAAEHVELLRKRLQEGKDEIGRHRDHMADMSRWIEQTDRHLGEERARRQADGFTPADD